jgi:hypothetical protein
MILSLRKPRILVDPSTGEQFEFNKKHEFFFIPVKYWSAILVLIASFVLGSVCRLDFEGTRGC